MSQLFEIPRPDQNEFTSSREPAVPDPNQPPGHSSLLGTGDSAPSAANVSSAKKLLTARGQSCLSLRPVVHDPNQAARIERLAQVGATPEDIAVELQMPLKRLRKRFRRELERGAVRGKHDLLEKLFDNASSGANASATSLWVKARCGWRDTGPVPNEPTPIQYVLEVVTKSARPNEKQKESPS